MQNSTHLHTYACADLPICLYVCNLTQTHVHMYMYRCRKAHAYECTYGFTCAQMSCLAPCRYFRHGLLQRVMASLPGACFFTVI